MLGREQLDGKEVFHCEGLGYSLTYASGFTKTKESTWEEGFGVRVLKNGRLGFSYCDKEKDLKNAVDNAISLTKFSPKTGFSFPKKAGYKKMNLVDRKIQNMQPDELNGIIGQMRDGIERNKGRPRIILSSGMENIRLENSEGFSGNYSETGLSIYTEAMNGDGYGFAYEESIFLPKDFTAFGERAGEMATAMKGAKKPKPGKYNVVFALTALDDLLNVLFPSFSGDWKRKGTSLLANKLGKKVFNSSLTIHDDPTALASDARPFDDEGTISRKTPLVEKGVLKNFIYDRESAALEGVRKSGFCSRANYSSPPGSSSSNIVIKGGDYKSLEQELDRCIILHSVQGSHIANVTTGDFGFEVSVAFLKERGREAVPVRGFLVSGNVFKLLNGNMYIEKKTEMRGSMIAPKIGFENMQVIS